MRKWAVNSRLEANGYSIPKEAQKWAIKTYTEMGDKLGKGGVYTFLPDGSLAFLGGALNKHFPNCYGWFPKEFPYDDPYQAVYKGMTAKEFARILESMGFKEVKS